MKPPVGSSTTYAFRICDPSHFLFFPLSLGPTPVSPCYLPSPFVSLLSFVCDSHSISTPPSSGVVIIPVFLTVIVFFSHSKLSVLFALPFLLSVLYSSCTDFPTLSFILFSLIPAHHSPLLTNPYISPPHTLYYPSFPPSLPPPSLPPSPPSFPPPLPPSYVFHQRSQGPSLPFSILLPQHLPRPLHGRPPSFPPSLPPFLQRHGCVSVEGTTEGGVEGGVGGGSEGGRGGGRGELLHPVGKGICG